MTVDSDFDVFLKKVWRGGIIFDPKNYIADFVGFKTVYFGRKFWKKCPKRGGGGGVISNPKNFIANLRKLAHIYELSEAKSVTKKGRKFLKDAGVDWIDGLIERTIHIPFIWVPLTFCNCPRDLEITCSRTIELSPAMKSYYFLSYFLQDFALELF